MSSLWVGTVSGCVFIIVRLALRIGRLHDEIEDLKTRLDRFERIEASKR